MKTAKEVAAVSIFTALLTGGQFVFSAVAGVEIVTALLVCFCFYFGVKRGLWVANAFSVLRCFIFGFFPTVIILYLIYYNLFAVVFGLIGLRFKREFSVRALVVSTLSAVIMTVLFTVLDDIITPLYYGFTLSVAKAYALASLTAMIPQIICAAVTVALLFPVLIRLFKGFKINGKKGGGGYGSSHREF